MSKAPDYTAPLVGIRQWFVGNNMTLYSLAGNIAWPARHEMLAKCPLLPSKLSPSKHTKPPVMDCLCGLYAYYPGEKERCRKRHDWIRGIVSATGKVILCEFAFKAERMQIEALVLGEDKDIPYKKLATRYGVSLITEEEVHAYCELHEGISLGRQWPQESRERRVHEHT